MTFSFRIIPGSDYEKTLQAMIDTDGKPTRKDLVADGHHNGIVYSLFRLAEAADNFSISRQGASYVDVVPTTVVQEAENVTGDVIAADQPQAHSANDTPVLWPECPFILQTDQFSWFRKPSFYDRMAAMIDMGKHISLAGPPGIGKSSAVEYLAAERGIPLVNISADSGLRRRDLVGNVELVNSHTQFQVALYLAAVKFGWWVKIDEVNAAEPDALMYINSQLAPPYSANYYGKQVPVHPDFRMFVTYNPGLIGTKPLPQAFKDRFFPVKLEFPTEYQLRAMLVANGMPELTGTDDWQNAVVAYGVRAWEAHKAGRMRYQITPRRLMDTVDLVKSGEGVFDALEQAVIAAVDNHSEVNVLKSLLREIKRESEMGRL